MDDDLLKKILGLGNTAKQKALEAGAAVQGVLEEGGRRAGYVLNDVRQNPNKYNIFSQVGEGNLKSGFDPLDQVVRGTVNIGNNIGRDALQAGKFAGGAFIQAPVLAATGGKVNVPFMSDQEFSAFDTRRADFNPMQPAQETFNKFFVPAANTVTAYKAPASYLLSGTIGATGKAYQNAAQGKGLTEGIDQGFSEGTKNAWLFALTNDVTNKILPKLGLAQFTDDALNVTFQAAKGKVMPTAIAIAKQIARGVLETPIETAGVAGFKALSQNRDFIQAFQEELIPTLTGNIIFNGGIGTIKGGTPFLQQAIKAAIDNAEAAVKNINSTVTPALADQTGGMNINAKVEAPSMADIIKRAKESGAQIPEGAFKEGSDLTQAQAGLGRTLVPEDVGMDSKNPALLNKILTQGNNSDGIQLDGILKKIATGDATTTDLTQLTAFPEVKQALDQARANKFEAKFADQAIESGDGRALFTILKKYLPQDMQKQVQDAVLQADNIGVGMTKTADGSYTGLGSENLKDRLMSDLESLQGQPPSKSIDDQIRGILVRNRTPQPQIEEVMQSPDKVKSAIDLINNQSKSVSAWTNQNILQNPLVKKLDEGGSFLDLVKKELDPIKVNEKELAADIQMRANILKTYDDIANQRIKGKDAEEAIDNAIDAFITKFDDPRAVPIENIPIKDKSGKPINLSKILEDITTSTGAEKVIAFDKFMALQHQSGNILTLNMDLQYGEPAAKRMTKVVNQWLDNLQSGAKTDEFYQPATPNKSPSLRDILTNQEGKLDITAKVVNPLKGNKNPLPGELDILNGGADALGKSPKMADVIENSSKGKKPRGFLETIQKDPNTPQEAVDLATANPKNYYEPITNQETLDSVRKNILSKGEDYALNYAKKNTSTDANATAMLLMEQYIKKGEFEKFDQLNAAVSPRFTKQGQQIQILSQYAKLTPTGAARYAQKLVDQANESLPPNQQIKLTRENLKEISDAAAEIQKLPEGSRERLVATAQLMDKFAATVPPSLASKVSALQTMAQLLNPKTLIRNTLGNLTFAAIDNISNLVGAGIDKGLSLVTGQRTRVAPDLGIQAKGFVTGLKEGTDDALKGIDTSPGVQTQFSLPRRTFRDGVLGWAEKALNVGLRATDRAAYTAARDESLQNQMKAALANGNELKEPTEQMLEQAHYDGLYRTFQDDNKISEFATNFKKLLNKPTGGEFGLGDLVLKYPKTPSNLLARGLDYSPVGVAQTLIKTAKDSFDGNSFNQRAFVDGISRGLVGSGIIATGYIMGKLGIMTGKGEKDQDIRAAQRAVGEGAFKLNVDAFRRWVASGFQEEAAKQQKGDLLVSYDWSQPQSFVLAMGANAALPTSGDKKVSNALEQLAAAEESLTEQPVARNPIKLAQDINNKGLTRAIVETGVGTPSSLTPSVLNQAGQATDNQARETYDPNPFAQEMNRVLARLPGFRGSLPAQQDTLGRDRKVFDEAAGGNSLFNVFINPSFVSRIKEDPQLDEVLRLYEQTGDVGQAPRIVDKKIKINGEMKTLSRDELVNYQNYMGENTQRLFEETMNSSKYNALSDEDKVKELENILKDVNTAAKIKIFGNEPSKNQMNPRVRSLLLDNTSGAARSQKQSATDMSVGTKTLDPQTQKVVDLYDLGKYMTESGGEGIDKYKNKESRLKVARSLYRGDDKYSEISDTDRNAIIEAMGYKLGDIQYDYIASQTTDVKYQYIQEKIDEMDTRQDMLIMLREGREKSVGGSQVVSNTILDQLYNDDVISKTERDMLKAITDYKDGEPVLKKGAKYGKADGSSKSKEETLTKTEINSIIKSGQSNIPKISQIVQNTSTPRVKVPTGEADATIKTPKVGGAPNIQEVIAKSRPTAKLNLSKAKQVVAQSRQRAPSLARLKLTKSTYRSA